VFGYLIPRLKSGVIGKASKIILEVILVFDSPWLKSNIIFNISKQISYGYTFGFLITPGFSLGVRQTKCKGFSPGKQERLLWEQALVSY
jgi:hypothetical protein